MPPTQPLSLGSIEPLPFSPPKRELPRDHRGYVFWELVLGVFLGVYGVGYVLSGRTWAGLGRLGFSFIWAIVRIALLAFTAGTAIICLLPITVLVAITNSISLHRLLRQADLAL
jgi:hypothetical protein